MLDSSLLSRLDLPNDIPKLTSAEKEVLAKELRRSIIDVVTQNGGHLAPSLGVVELTIALLSCFDPARDSIIWDVGHQSYPWKLLTGRADRFNTLRKRFSLPKDKAIKDFSTGMRAKLNIAVALSHKAQLLVLDEATSGLDPVVRDEILDILQDFVQDENHSVLISSHITSDLEKICDYIAFIRDGEIVFVENKDDLINNYAIIHCKNDEFAAVNPDAVISHKQNSFSTQALVFKDKLTGEYVMDKPSIEDIMLYYTKEVQ